MKRLFIDGLNFSTIKIRGWLPTLLLGYSGLGVLPLSHGSPRRIPRQKVSLTGLVISPTQVSVGQTVTISATATNTWHKAGAVRIACRADGIAVEQSVTLSPGGSKKVSFSVTPSVAKTYSVSVDGLTGSFKAVAAPSADIRVTSLVIKPAEVNVGEMVAVSVTATNHSTFGGMKIITCIIDVTESSQTVSLQPSESKLVTFETIPLEAKTYYVRVDKLEGSFIAHGVPSKMLRLNVKSYGNHDTLSYSDTLGKLPYDDRILAVGPEYVIDNPPHGLYGEMDEQQYHEGYTYTYLLQNISGYHAAGIKIIGYITGGYEGKGGDDHYALKWYSLQMNKMLIQNMATIDKVDGVFIDECSESPNAASRAYLKALTDLAHSLGLITWGNTGVDSFDEWFFTEGGFDLMQSSEAWVGQNLSAVQAKWGHRIAVTGYSKTYTAEKAFQLTVDAWSKGLAYCYINTTEYVSIAPWFERYASMLRAV